MKKYILISSLAIISLSVSCSEDKKNNDEVTTPENGVETSLTPSENTTVESQPLDLNQQPGITANPSAAGGAPAPAASYPAGTKLNPAHGEPGHKCEVAVGAPLPADGSTPSMTATPQNIQMQSPVQSQPTPITATPSGPPPTSIMNSSDQSAPAAVTTTAPGMNPAHGQPGHDCAIPVGSPLKK